MNAVAQNTDQPELYSRIAQSLHWISMFVIIAVWIGGAAMTNFLSPDSPMTANLYRVHVLGGNIVLLLTLVRVGMAFFEKRPAPPEGVTGWKRIIFEGNHYALYVILLGLAFSGSAMLILSGLTPQTMSSLTPDMIQDVPPRAGHDLFSKLFLLLLIMHTVGVLRYQFAEGDVMKRMGVNFPGRKSA